MRITNQKLNFCDNTKQLQQNDIFVKTFLNEKYINEVTNHKIIDADKLIQYFDFSSIKIVGVTGTNGKTTTSGAIYSILIDLGYKVALLGTRGFFINDLKIKDKSLTTPTLLELFDDILIAIEKQCDFFIMEVSSHAIAQNRIAGIPFSLKIHTNITRDHINYHKTLQNYIDTKNSFFADDTPKLINKDDTNIKFNYKGTLSYALDSMATYKVEAYSLKDGMSVAFKFHNQLYSFHSHLLGVFNIYNLLAAVASVHMLTNRNLVDISYMVENFGGISGRCEIVSYDPLIVIDFAHTPDGMKQIFEAFNNKEIIVVFGAGGNKDIGKRYYMGKIATQYAKKIIITSDNPRFEDPIKIANDIIQGLQKDYIVELNRKKAIQIGIDEAKKIKNSALLILGKGDEEYQQIYDQKFAFNDKKVVLKLLS